MSEPLEYAALLASSNVRQRVVAAEERAYAAARKAYARQAHGQVKFDEGITSFSISTPTSWQALGAVDEYEIDSVRAHRYVDGALSLNVQWGGYPDYGPDDERSWSAHRQPTLPFLPLIPFLVSFPSKPRRRCNACRTPERGSVVPPG
ncbi:hypothetical protein PAPYR_9548 [Paratrimastix pyriformis]|uniref:Uncharacterized protein n=1 Tax=Paratrimastix pyriformis TaxID=342808 RepID=A0ABQ8U862_9EUKA|nr:hypothetical protein PAPYR_9548 [Paratrimastix pyriformis]